MPSCSNLLLFENGDKVEVTRNNDSSRWFSAIIVRSFPAKHKGQVYVQYETLSANAASSNNKPLREYVSAANVRPSLLFELHRYFKVGDSVDAFHVNAWRAGTVANVLENSSYSVSFQQQDQDDDDDEEEEEVFQHWNLRLHREWDDGSWLPPLQDHQLNKGSELDVKHRDMKLRIKCGGKTSGLLFTKGTVVEIKRDKEGYEGSWYTAVIVELVWPERFMVVYKTLWANDGTAGLLNENVDASNMRPSPPVMPQDDNFKEFQQVNVWYMDGWWVAHVIKVIDEYLYLVRLMSSCAEMIVEHSKLRPHQDWIDGKWVAASKKLSGSAVKCPKREVKLKIKFSGRTEKPKFSNGTLVEVKSNEEGYQGSWYTATIVGSMRDDKFLVEYQTLKTEDHSHLLQETTDAFSIRPCPPVIQRLDRFKLFEKVDAWYNDGWWLGLVSRALDGLKYIIYFWNTNEELELGHFDLRPHQELIGGKWVADFLRKPSELAPKPRPGNLKRQDGILKVGASYFPKGMKVEVTGDGDGYWYPAVVVCPTDTGRFLVEFKTLKADNEIGLLKKEIDVLSIRPSPPVIQRTESFEPSEKVDAWYNDMWCVGSIWKVFQGADYAVCIRGTGEVLQFQHSDLRPHRDWIDGKWVVP